MKIIIDAEQIETKISSNSWVGIMSLCKQANGQV